ncbi:MAG: DHH family phosphoesterase, partial [Spirochaetaceae bacterium]|nr:DHH family phosphoesterase [Spirochaetaceae bacterium]
MKTELIVAMKEAVEVLKTYPSKTLKLFHHNDTDGLSSGTILLGAFTDAGYDVARFSLEKPYPQVLEKIFSEEGQIVVFTDFAGKIAPMIAELNNGRNLVLIIDHHPAEKSGDNNVFNLDGELFGLKGDRDISASATCFLFARVMLESIGLSADLMSPLGALGAIGDGFLVDGKLSGVNRDVVKIAESKHLMRIVKKELGEEYFITLGETEYPAAVICVSLDTLGGVGYYNNGTDFGIELCQRGVTPDLQ